MKNFLNDNWFKIIIAFSILIVAVSIGYYFVIFVPMQNIEAGKQRTFERDEKCKTTADDFIKNEQKNSADPANEYFDETEVHFDTKLNACLLDYSDMRFNENLNWTREDTIVNLSTNEDLANYFSSNIDQTDKSSQSKFYMQQKKLMSE